MEGDRFGDHLRVVRRGHRLTQEELAEASGTSVRSIREMERNRVRAPHRRTTTLLADALGLSGDERDAFLDLAEAGRTAPAEVPTEVPVPAELPGERAGLPPREST